MGLGASLRAMFRRRLYAQVANDKREIHALKVLVERRQDEDLNIHRLYLVSVLDLLDGDLDRPYFPTLILAQPVDRWSDFIGADFNYSFPILAPGPVLRFLLDFSKLSRPDRQFRFEFNLRDKEHVNWLAVVYLARSLFVFNGPEGSFTASLSLRFEDPSATAPLKAAIDLARDIDQKGL